MKQFGLDKETSPARESLVNIFVIPFALTVLGLFALGIKLFGALSFDDMTSDLED